jgi:hypothetical protein
MHTNNTNIGTALLKYCLVRYRQGIMGYGPVFYNVQFSLYAVLLIFSFFSNLLIGFYDVNERSVSGEP